MNEMVTNQTNIEICFEQSAKLFKKKWLQDFRVQQLQRFLQQGLPTRKNELWKYTEIKESYFPEKIGARSELARSKKLSAIINDAYITLVFVNGYFNENLSNTKHLPKEVTLCSLAHILNAEEERVKPYLLRPRDEKRFPFAVLNSALIMDGVFLEIPKKVAVTTPIHLIFMNTQQQSFMTCPRNIIVANQESQVTFIEEHVAENTENYFTNAVTEIHAAENARIYFYKIQDDDQTALHVANVFVEQQQDSYVKTFYFSKGARLEREDLTVWQHAPGAEADLYGLYSLQQNHQHVDHHVHVDHLAAHGKSSMLYKGILNKKSHAVFNGKVHVHPTTKQINAHQANHNLLLSNDAQVNTKPELEIYAEDVKCTHGATIGQLDHEALFYLLSRGISQSEAHQMLVHAFAEEIYSKITDVKIREYLQKRMSYHDE